MTETPNEPEADPHTRGDAPREDRPNADAPRPLNPGEEPLFPGPPRRYRQSTRRNARRQRAKRRILKTTAVLPSLFTLGNGLLGFAAIHLATRQAVAGEPTHLAAAAWLLVAAMVCDMIDGRLARYTRRTSDFGGQLDSMCDIISFGVAPAVLMLRTVLGAIHGKVGKVAYLSRLSDVGVERLLWCAAGVYVAGAALRLARFNVENEPDEAAHMDFRGLPSPGAAGAVVALVLLLEHLKTINQGGWLFGPWLLAMNDTVALWLCAAISIVLPVVTVAAGLLMVSRLRYAHVINHYIRGKKPFGYLVKVVVILLVALLEPFVALAAAALGYALSGPAAYALTRLRRRAPDPKNRPKPP